MAIRVLVVDDHRVVRAGLVAFLRQSPGLDVVGEAGNGEEAVKLAAELTPDVILMDMQMPVLNGVEATRLIKAQLPRTEVLVLTTYDDDDLIWGGLQAGARGYLLKDAPPEELIRGIEAVSRGQSLLPPTIAAKLMQVITQGGPAKQAEAAEVLTERELEILRLMARGAANKEIAGALYISENTVKTHISNLFGKLGARDRTEAVTKALSRGLISL